MFAEYIDVSLANLPSNSWRRVNYEDFWRPQEERDKIFQALATDYLHWSSDAHDSFVNSQFDLNVHPRKYKTADRPPCEVYISKVFYLWEKMVLGFRGIYEKKR